MTKDGPRGIASRILETPIPAVTSIDGPARIKGRQAMEDLISAHNRAKPGPKILYGQDLDSPKVVGPFMQTFNEMRSSLTQETTLEGLAGNSRGQLIMLDLLDPEKVSISERVVAEKCIKANYAAVCKALKVKNTSLDTTIHI